MIKANNPIALNILIIRESTGILLVKIELRQTLILMILRQIHKDLTLQLVLHI